MPKMKFKPRKDRYDIYNNIPHGGLTKIAKACGCNESQVTNVLRGLRTDNHGIIKAAEMSAALNLWKTRFCKLGKSQL